MPLPITEHVVCTSRHTSFYLACGAEDAPAIIFLHYWGGTSRTWSRVAAKLQDKFRTVAYDARVGDDRTSQQPDLHSLIWLTKCWRLSADWKLTSL